MLDQLKKQHAEFVAQRDQMQTNFQQLTGAIYACEVMMKKLQGESKDGQVDNETTQ